MAVTPMDASPAPPLLRTYRPVKRRIRPADVWTTRDVARMIGIRDIKAKYKQAALGPLWLLIAPLGLLAAMVVAFSGVTNVRVPGVPYVPFALVGLTVWTFVQLSASLSAQMIVTNAILVRRSPLPRIALVTGSLLGNVPPVAVMFTVALVTSIASRGVTARLLLLPGLVAWLFFFTFAIALLISGLAARFRDIVAALPLIIQAGIFVSPVGYPLAGSPARIHTLLMLNPISGLIEAWRWVILDMPSAEWGAVGIAAAWTVVLATVGWRVYGRLEVKFADFV